MWEPEGKRQVESALGDLKPEEILFEFEEPLTFVCSDSDGQKLLAHSLCDGDGFNRYLVVVTSVRILDDLKAGRIDLVGALKQPRCWLVDFVENWAIKNLWIISFDKIPKALIPKSGVMLLPGLQSLFRVRWSYLKRSSR